MEQPTYNENSKSEIITTHTPMEEEDMDCMDQFQLDEFHLVSWGILLFVLIG